MGTDRADDCNGALPKVRVQTLMQGLHRRRLQCGILCCSLCLLLWTRTRHYDASLGTVATAGSLFDDKPAASHLTFTRHYHNIIERSLDAHDKVVATSTPCIVQLAAQALPPLIVHVHTKLFDLSDPHGRQCRLHSETIERYNITFGDSTGWQAESLVSRAIAQSLGTTVGSARKLCSTQMCDVFAHKIGPHVGYLCDGKIQDVHEPEGEIVPVAVVREQEEDECIAFDVFMEHIASAQDQQLLLALLDVPTWQMIENTPQMDGMAVLMKNELQMALVAGMYVYGVRRPTAELQVIAWQRVALVRKPWEGALHMWELWGHVHSPHQYTSTVAPLDNTGEHTLNYGGACVKMHVDDAYAFNMICTDTERIRAKQPLHYVEMP